MEELNSKPHDGTVVTISSVPDKFEYEADAFLTPEPYDTLQKYTGSKFVYQVAVERMRQNALEVGFKGFNKMLRQYHQSLQDAKRQYFVPNQTEFDEQALELNCGEWISNDWGIYRDTAMGGKEYACTHAIMPVERLVNIDTGEVKMRLAYKRSGSSSKWRTTIVENATISTARNITALASQGISVTSNSAAALVDYLNCLSEKNYDIIPERKSIGRLGYIEGEGFSPYVEDLVFDGDASFRAMYQAVQEHGSEVEWYRIALECRKMSVTARIMLAASFASPLLSVVGSLPFFVHLWGVDSGTGKTVALMLAASVWGNPAVGSYTQTFNGTQVGQERTAAFLNHLPYCLDELQLTKDSRGKSNFDVYQLAQGVGRSRGKRTGGIEVTPTWDCCFLTTGESPLTSISSGAGAINRVIDIECTAGAKVIQDGQRVSGVLKNNYGYAGRIFVEKVYSSEAIRNAVKELYQQNFRDLCEGDSTEKQAMAAAAIITADQMATAWIFKDDMALTVKDIQEFLASREAVSAGRRAYDWLCDWVASNVNRFYNADLPPTGEIYGVIEGNTAFINRGVFNRVILESGFSGSATLSYLKANRLIEVSGRKYTKCKRVNGVRTECVALYLPNDSGETNDLDELPL